jgi:hypothetical protein
VKVQSNTIVENVSFKDLYVKVQSNTKRVNGENPLNIAVADRQLNNDRPEDRKNKNFRNAEKTAAFKHQ